MAHARKQIRDAVGAALIAAATVAGARVHLSRVYPLQAANLPALRIYTTDEASETDERTMGADPQMLRKQLLIVEGVLKQTADIDDAMDELAAEVEIALAENMLGDLIKDIVIAGTNLDINADGEQPVGVVTMSYEVLYMTTTTDPETALQVIYETNKNEI